MTLQPDNIINADFGGEENTHAPEYPIEFFTPLGRLVPSKNTRGGSGFLVEEDCYIKFGDSRLFIKKGFFTDGATSHWLLRPSFPGLAKYFGATTVHDIYCNKANESGLYSARSLGDRMFYENLRICGVGRIRARLMSAGVTKWGKYLRRIGKLK